MDSATNNKLLQYVLTFGIGGVIGVLMWPRLDGISRFVVLLFGIVAAMSIHNGTWLEDSRKLRRESRDSRRQAYTEVKQWVKGTKAS